MTEEEDCLLLLDPIASLQDDDKALFEEDDFDMEDDVPAFFLLLLDPIVPSELQDDDEALFEDDCFTSLRELEDDEAILRLLLLLVMPAGACPELVEREPASPFLLLLEGRFPLEVGMTEEEDEDETYSSLFEEVPLSPPQANKEAQSAMLATTKMQLFKNDNLKSLINTPTTGKIYNFPIDGIYLTPS